MSSSSIPGRSSNIKKFDFRSPVTELYGPHPPPLHGKRKFKNLETEIGYRRHWMPLSVPPSAPKTTTPISMGNSSSSTVLTPSESSLISGLINYIWDKQYELDCQTDPFPGDVINFRTSTTRALNNWRTLWDNMIPHLKMDRAQWARLGFFRNSLEYWYAAKLFLARPRRSGWAQPYDDDNNLFRVKRLLRIVRVWVVGGETKSGLSKRDLRVPNFLETLKVVVPELASVRIEEAPSAVPSPRPMWKSSIKKEEKN
jgi:hypothetical protein